MPRILATELTQNSRVCLAGPPVPAGASETIWERPCFTSWEAEAGYGDTPARDRHWYSCPRFTDGEMEAQMQSGNPGMLTSSLARFLTSPDASVFWERPREACRGDTLQWLCSVTEMLA